MNHGAVDDPPLVGRATELEATVAALHAGHRRGVVIVGPAGVGKTRLAQEATSRLGAHGWAIFAARTSASATSLPLAALAGLLTLQSEGDPDSGSWNLGPVQRALDALRRRAAEHPRGRVVLWLDDAHLLDDASATAVYHAVAEGTLTVLATVRSDKPTSDAVTALWKDGDAARVDLGALPRQDADALIGAMLGGPVEGRTLHRFRETAAGNPLFLRELLTSAREAGLLTEVDGVWRLTGPLGASPRLTELLRDRLATTDPAERDALEIMAFGEPLELRAATALVGDSTLESLERRRLVTVTAARGCRMVRLAHPLYGELLRAGTPEVARLRYARQLADALEGTREELMRVALWRLEAGGTLDAALMLDAAGEAAQVREYDLAERLARRAYEAGGRVAAGLTAVRALFQLGRLDEALRLCTELRQVAVDDPERVAVAVQHAALLAHGTDDVRAGLTVVDEVVVTDPDCREQLGVFRLYLRTYQLDCTVLAPALAAFRNARSVDARLAAAAAAAGALMLTGRYAECSALVQEALPLAARHTGLSHIHADSMPVALGWMRADLPDPVGATEDAMATYEASLHPTAPVGQALAAFSLAKIALQRGRPLTALRWAKEARLAAGELHLKEAGRVAGSLRLQAASQLGNPKEIAEAATDLDRNTGGPYAIQIFDLEVARGQAWHAAATGDPAGARHVLAGEITRHGRLGALGPSTLGALDLVRLGEPALAAKLLATYPPPGSWELGRLTVAYASAASHGDAATLLELAREFAALGMPLHGAEAARMASASWHAAGDGRAGRRARLLAAALLAECEDAVTPALRLDGPTEDLTEREREIAVAAAKGETTRALASRLHLSERTVENHLYRAYAKLGVAGRTELRAALSLSPSP
ncbi:AAA family ATPase [Micromonospora deserti]|uniref:HTH luxR-type domain-containing protein n=1 Tax=Micromonospora deserti TaxID=2070366 RepID=A0A2W2CPR4_9ACTN|nr:LuxR family transcriptional regulator [Micromonospora deserti]PZG01512.1 hypothetical protein C1I99_06800 [Micromonospora deserti]